MDLSGDTPTTLPSLPFLSEQFFTFSLTPFLGNIFLSCPSPTHLILCVTTDFLLLLLSHTTLTSLTQCPEKTKHY